MPRSPSRDSHTVAFAKSGDGSPGKGRAEAGGNRGVAAYFTPRAQGGMRVSGGHGLAQNSQGRLQKG